MKEEIVHKVIYIYLIPLFYCAHIVYCRKVWAFIKCLIPNSRDTCRNSYIYQIYTAIKRIIFL